ncbi:hypothetical protein [Sinorhizobium sp. BG8]|uniref:hypothetical protein n=1 Tax=Sinorhizobium sp. BG8 TaxID=2613773 RepID=UPI00193DA78F|nr:hypothetical protein [Sinorhizobium sp. BG8]QRM54705.1 hypothetical protein F3Y30_09255 [Sinorhizobium sp. BG8]
MGINRKFFFDYVRLHLFDGALTQPQVRGLTAIIDKWEATMPGNDDRWLAYMLATTHYETGRTMQPVRETFAPTDDKAIAILDRAFNAGRLPWVSRPYWNKDAQGRTWLGRGLVQLTHEANYQKMTNETGIDLVSDPALAMDLKVAVDIMFIGMTKGSFTGKKLADFFAPGKGDWVNARKIINGLDKAALVGSYGKAYYAAISYTT